LDSCTQAVRAFGCLHPRTGSNVVIIDTPGFDDSKRTDYDILKAISRWLEETYRRDITLTGILELHNIMENRMGGASRKNLEIFQQLCGIDALRNVILTTTFWDQVPEDVASMREARLKSKFWEPMIRCGCQVARFQPRTYESAWSLIDRFDATAHRPTTQNLRPPLQLQREIVDEGKKLQETGAFRVILEWWTRAIEKLKGLLRKRETQGARQELKRAVNEKRRLEDRDSECSPAPARLQDLHLRSNGIQLRDTER